ncbi:MAG TPA: adenylate/guanylate cyclase domain-containing protein [Vicinamibacterales bacterium]|nr:adenylate/guanylate cyclase domain-containing protein [Vicinamibacterales bacterium]
MVGDPIEGVASYVPARVARQVAANPSQPDGPRADRFTGAVLLADISGFTGLAESLGCRGEVGVEDLTRCLNVYFGRLIDLIVEHGGDIVKFAGDALLAIWPADAEDLALSTSRAVQCALATQARLQDFPVTPDVHLSLRIGLSAGPLSILHVGGVEGRRELVATGEPLAGMSAANAEARPGDLVVSAEAWALVRDRIVGEPLTGGAFRVDGLRDPVPLLPPLPIPAADPQSLLAYVPPAVVDQVGRGDSGWLAELRHVSVLFANFPGLTPATPLERAHTVMRELQTILYRYEGTINKVSVDDKGASVVAAMGLPPLSHEDDPERAVRAALAIRDRLALMQVRHSIGIATGLTFCGIVGNTTRREYTMIGDVVNLAARLMQAAKGGILCDRATCEASQARLAFEALPSIHVKGKAGDIAVYHPLESVARPGAHRAEATHATLGRVREQQAIEQALRDLAERGEGAVIVFEGMVGLGKSRLIDEARRRARRFGLSCLESGGDAMEKSTAFYAWRNIFEHAFGLDPSADTGERQVRVSARLAARGRKEWGDLLPLLNPVLRTSFPPTEITTSMDERARASATYDVLADLLVALPQDGSCHVVLLEDAQWMDSASLALASRICARAEPLVLVLATRPIPGPALEEIEALSRTARGRRFDLEPLGPDEAVEIACRALGVASVPDAVEAIIRSKAEGNPLLIQELAGGLRDSGLIQVTDGECRLAPGAGDLRSVDLPNNIQAAVAARMDRLSPSQRLVLKFASVVGRVFESDVVVRLHQGQADEASVLADLRALEGMRVIALERSDPAPVYAFHHLAFQEVAYRQMLFAQRRQLHQAMAELLEERHAAALSAAYPLLALHWRRAVEEADAEPALVWKAIDYLQKAGEQALQQFANHEAVEFLNGALRLLKGLPESVERSRKELGLCCLVGAPLLVTKGMAAPETERAYSRASELCQEVENSPEQFRAVYGLWTFALMSTHLSRARGLAAEVFRIAQAAGDPELLLPAHRAVGDTSFWLGDPTAARAHLEQVMALYRPENHAHEVFRSGQDQGVVAGALSAWALWLLGYPDTALARMEETIALARRVSHAHTLAMTFQNFTMMHQFRGEAAPVLEKVETQMKLSREGGFPLWLAAATIMRGWARARQGASEEGIGEMRRGLDEWRATGAELAAPYYLGLLAEAHGAAGQPEKGLEVVLEALDSSARSGEAWWRAEVWRIDAELRLKLATPDESAAERRLLDALELARAQRARSLELRAAVSLFRLWTKQRKPLHEAVQPLADVFNWFTEGHGTADLKEAANLLGAVSASSSASTRGR